jgi:hypothetical protein
MFQKTLPLAVVAPPRPRSFASGGTPHTTRVMLAPAGALGALIAAATVALFVVSRLHGNEVPRFALLAPIAGVLSVVAVVVGIRWNLRYRAIRREFARRIGATAEPCEWKQMFWPSAWPLRSEHEEDQLGAALDVNGVPVFAVLVPFPALDRWRTELVVLASVRLPDDAMARFIRPELAPITGRLADIGFTVELHPSGPIARAMPRAVAHFTAEPSRLAVVNEAAGLVAALARAITS